MVPVSGTTSKTYTRIKHAWPNKILQAINLQPKDKQKYDDSNGQSKPVILIT